MQEVRYKNALLNALESKIISRLHLSFVKFETGHEIEFPGMPIEHLYFLEEGMASITTTFRDGSQVEVGMFGYEAVIGVSALMGARRSLNRINTQIAGSGYSLPIAEARREFDLGGRFQSLLLRYVQAQLLQTMQSAGCNARHSLEQRLSGWLLLCADRVQSNRFAMSHDFLAGMLGTTRTSVSLTAGKLKRRGIIQYSRGKISLLDRDGLKRTACECHCILKSHLLNPLEYESGIPEPRGYEQNLLQN